MSDDRFERLANLVTFLLDAGERRQGGASYDEIVQSIPGYPEVPESRRRAFERDKALLRDEDVPLVERDGRYHIPPEEYYLPDLGLSEAEQLALQLAINAVPLGDDSGGSALQKLTFGGGVGSPTAMAPLADVDAHPLLPALHAAIRRHCLVTFTYRGATRDVEPGMLFFREGNWYLAGDDRLREATRNFRVDRIEGDVTVGDPGGFQRRAAGAGGPGSTEAVMPREPWLYEVADAESEEAVVRVDAMLAAKAVSDAGAMARIERHNDGSVTITMPVRNREPFRSWVLALLDHAEVVGPPELRRDVVDWLQDMAR